MSKKTKTWLIIGAVLILIGGIIFTGVMTSMGWDFKKLSTNKMVTNEYTVSETYRNISLKTVTADILFVPSDGEETRVVCYEEEKVKHTVKVEDGTLVIDVQDGRKWYNHIGFHFNTPKITVTVPKGAYGALTVNATTGDVKLPRDFTFASVNVSVTTGDIMLSASATGDITCKTTTGDVKFNGVRCANLTSTGTTGDLEMKDVIATGTMNLKRGTGDVEFDACDAAELYIKVTTGDVEGTLLSEKIFHAKATTGEVKVPQTTSGGICEVKATTGDIQIRIR